MILVLLLTATLGAEPQAPAPSAPPSPADATLKRVGEMVAKPPALQVTLPEPTYRVEVRGSLYYSDLPLKWGFESNVGGAPLSPAIGASGSQPLIKVNLMPAARALGNVRAKRAEKDAREEMMRAYAEFCTTHACH